MDEKIFRKINILEVASVIGYAGGARNLVSFCKYLNRNFFNVFAMGYAKGGAGERKLSELKVEYILANSSLQKIELFLREKQIDVIHIHRSGNYVDIEYNLLKKAKEINPKIIIIEKNVFGKYHSGSSDLIDCSFFQSMMHLNERYLPRIKNEFDFSRMKVLYNMVDAEEFEKFRLTNQEICDFKNDIGILKSDFVIGRIGRSDLAKWSDLILDMFPYALKLVPNLKFVIIGAPDSRKRKILKSLHKDRFVFIDETGDEKLVHSFYQVIDVLVHSSKIGECNGNTINEAFFWKKPVIVNSTPRKDNGQLEQVEHFKNGFIANHPQTFARALELLYKSPNVRQYMGDFGHEKVIEKLQPSLITSQVEKFCVEKLSQTAVELTRHIPVDFYASVEYYPSKQEIMEYKIEYQNRISQEYGAMSMIERVTNFLKKPVKFFYKLRDFIEHKFFYVGK